MTRFAVGAMVGLLLSALLIGIWAQLAEHYRPAPTAVVRER